MTGKTWQVTYGNVSLPCRTENDARLLAQLVKKGHRVAASSLASVSPHAGLRTIGSTPGARSEFKDRAQAEHGRILQWLAGERSGRAGSAAPGMPDILKVGLQRPSGADLVLIDAC